MKKIGFIDLYLDEWHANQYIGWIRDVSGGELSVAAAWAEMNSPKKGGLSTEAWCKKYEVEQADSIEALIGQSDCLLVLAPENPEKHWNFCQPALSSGKPVYVDKPFCLGSAEADRLFALAEKNHTPCFSASPLLYASEFQNIRRNTIQSLASWGPGHVEDYAVHQIEPLLFLMGGVARSVLCTGTKDWPSFVIEFSDGRRASWAHHGEGTPYAMAIDHADGSADVLTVQSDFFRAFIQALCEFYLTGTPQAPHAQTIAVMGVQEAAVKALRTPGIWITVQ